MHHSYACMATATRAARAAREKLQRGVAEFTITRDTGRPELMPETPALVQGWKPIIDSTLWLLAEVEHVQEDNGYTSRVRLEMRLHDLEEEN